MTEVEMDRRVLHCDMDCFYAAVHMRDEPGLAGKPVVIGGSPEGRGVVAAASYEARRFGIHSALPAATAVRLCPQAIFIKPDFTRYREESQQIVRIFREFTTVIQQVSIDEAYLDVTEHLEPWGSGTAVAQEIKRRVRLDRGLTVSVGVAPNRLVAKIASDFDKPDGLTVVKPAMVQRFLDPLSVRTLPGVGPASEQRLKKHGIEKVAELRALPQDRLEALFGKNGRWLYNCARGLDDRPVRTHRERKSLSSERTYSQDLTRLEEMDTELDRLAERVSRGLKKRELSAQTVTVKVRYGDFTTLTRSHTLPSPTSDEAVMASWAHRLLRRTEAGRRSVRLLGLGAGKLVHGEVSQLELF
jgi:DNA polymerase-4